METSVAFPNEQVRGRSDAQGLNQSSIKYVQAWRCLNVSRHLLQCLTTFKMTGETISLCSVSTLKLEPIASFLLPIWSLESGFVFSIMITVIWLIKCPSAFPSPCWTSLPLAASPPTSCALAPDQPGGPSLGLVQYLSLSFTGSSKTGHGALGA